VQEALANTIRHGGANAAQVSCALDGDRLTITVFDHGCGFDPGAERGADLSFAGLRERVESIGGDFDLTSAPGNGARLTLTLHLGDGRDRTRAPRPPVAAADAIRVAIVDDHPLFRGGVVSTIQETPDFEVVGQGASADDALALVARHMPDPVCLDISMPGGGIEAARRIGAGYPAVRIVMLTASEEDEDVLAALKAGARGYVLKGVGASELVGVLRGVARGESYVSLSLAARVLSAMQGLLGSGAAPDPLADLTKREEQILRHVARGLSNKEVGRELDLQEKTVKHYMTDILQKLQV
jgi:two-component system nitrate/nitrite response regulator NarL